MRYIILAMITLCAPIANAEETSMYADEAAMLADLEAMAVRCGTMADGQVDPEIFGITVTRVGDRCIVGEGEVDPMAVAVFSEDRVKWAGLHEAGAIWVEAR